MLARILAMRYSLLRTGIEEGGIDGLAFVPACGLGCGGRVKVKRNE